MSAKRDSLLLIKIILFFFNALQASNLGSSFSGFVSTFDSIGNMFQAMGQSFSGTVPSGYSYAFRVFNGSNIPVTISIQKETSVMGAQWASGSGTSLTVQPQQDSGSSYSGHQAPNLYMNIEISGNGVSYSDPHTTLGIKNDPNIYYYNIYNDPSTGAPMVELLGSGYSTSTAFSGRIENTTNAIQQLTFGLYAAASQSTGSATQSTGSAVTLSTGTGSPSLSVTERLFTIPDIDTNSFNYLMDPTGYNIRSTNAVLKTSSATIAIPKKGIASLVQTDTSQPTLSNPSTYNYQIGSAGLVQTGMGPGHFNQPTTSNQIRDITPVICQVFNQNASQTMPIGALLPFDVSWQSLWYVYSGYGWSEQQQTVVQYPCGLIPRGSCTQFFLIRPSIAAITTNGPGLLYLIRLNVPENATGAVLQNVQLFLKSLVTSTSASSHMLISCLSVDAQGTNIITTDNTSTINWASYTNWNPFPQTVLYQPGSPIPAYPPLSAAALTSSTINPQTLSLFQRFTLLHTTLPNSVGVIFNSTNGITGSILLRDSFLSYGLGSGPIQYVSPAPYLDMSQMISMLMNVIGQFNLSQLNSTVLNQLIGTSTSGSSAGTSSVLIQVITGWLQAYPTQAKQVQASIATFLLMIAQNRVASGSVSGQVCLLDSAAFGGSTFTLYSEQGAAGQLSAIAPSAVGILNMLLYGPCSMTQMPIYHKVASGGIGQQSNWPAITAII